MTIEKSLDGIVHSLEEIVKAHERTLPEKKYEFSNAVGRIYYIARLIDIVKDDISDTSIPFHICTSSEYDATIHVPTVSDPDEGTIYMVPASVTETGNLFDEWIYVDSSWEHVGSTTIDANALKEEISEYVVDEIMDEVEASIPTTVTGWLNDHVNPESDAVIDDSLSISGAAADAAKVGELKSALGFNYSDTTLWESGSIDISNGANSVNSARLRTGYFEGSADTVTVNEGYKYLLLAYSGDTYVGAWNGTALTKAANWRTTLSNLYEIGNYNYRFVLGKSNDASISASDASNFIFHGYADTTLTQKGKAADAKSAGDKINKIKTDTENLVGEIANKVFRKVDFRNITGVSELLGYNMSRNGTTELRANTLTWYNAYYLYANKDFDIYFDTTEISDVSFIDISYIENAQPVTQSGTSYIVSGSNAVYYRKSNSDLPTSSSPLHVKQGSCVSITEGTSSGNWIVHLNDKLELAPDILLANAQLKQVENVVEEVAPTAKCMYIKYKSSPSDCVEVYIPNISGYVRYDFIRSTDNSINADIWRVNGAYHTDNSLVQDYVLTTSGEWEIAVKIKDRNDFSGGIAHGDEVFTDITFIVDGSPVDITAFTTLTQINELYIIENSNLYDPNDSTTVFANHNSIHIFGKDGLIIKQVCKYVAPEIISTAYMAMLPIAKAVSNMLVTDKDYVPVSISNNRINGEVSEVIIYKTSGYVQAIFSVPKFNFFGNNYKFLCLDNGSTEYNKCYFVNTLDDLSVSSGDTWESETKYKFVVGE